MTEPNQIAKLEAKVAELERRLTFDNLTGCYTRQYLMEYFDQKPQADGILLYLDLDGFKSVNDHYGHQAGDQLLQMIATAIMGAVADLGFVVRMAGDEFVIYIADTSDADFPALGAVILAAIRTTRMRIGALNVSRSATFGFVRMDPLMKIGEALSRADVALLEAKSGGKNRSLGYARPPVNKSRLNPSLDEVRQALKNGEIGYYVQPILRCSDLRIEGYEALLRWSRPSGKVLGPGQFLDTMTSAYDTETLPPLAAARATSEWAVLGRSRYISFNMSAAFVERVVNEGLAWVESVIGDTPSDRVVFELLETVVDERSEQVLEAVRRLRDRGIRVALDDFGIGHSNLKRLQGLEVDFVKIDKRFVHGATKDSRGLDLLGSIVDLSHRLGAQTIIEGIETAEQLSIARHVGASFAQGYFLGRPKPIEDSP